MNADVAASLEDLTAALEERYEFEAQELMRVRIAIAEARDSAAQSAAATESSRASEQALAIARRRLHVATATIKQQQATIEEVSAIVPTRALRSALRAWEAHQAEGLGRCFLAWRQFETRVAVEQLEEQAAMLRRKMRDGVSEEQWQQLVQQSHRVTGDLQQERAARAVTQETLAVEVARAEREASGAAATAMAAEEARRSLEEAVPVTHNVATSPQRPVAATRQPPSPPKSEPEPSSPSGRPPEAPPPPPSQPPPQPPPPAPPPSAAQAWGLAREQLLKLAAPTRREVPPPSLRVVTQEGMTVAHWAQPTSRLLGPWQTDSLAHRRLGLTQGRASVRAGIVPRSLTSPAMTTASMLLCAGALERR